jgi:hypothetical protein
VQNPSSYSVFNAESTPGFDYDFNSIEDDTNELFCAYREMFELSVSQQPNSIRQLLGIYFPIVDVVFVSGIYRPDRTVSVLTGWDSAGPGG